MASIEATPHNATCRTAQNAQAHVLFPTPPPALVPTPPCDPRVGVDSHRPDSHFGIRPALAALQNTFTSRRRASSVSDAASQRSSTPRPHFARFVGLEPRSRTVSSATVVVSNYLTRVLVAIDVFLSPRARNNTHPPSVSPLSSPPTNKCPAPRVYPLS